MGVCMWGCVCVKAQGVATLVSLICPQSHLSAAPEQGALPLIGASQHPPCCLRVVPPFPLAPASQVAPLSW